MASSAAAQSRYAGPYVASPARIEANVTEWGPDCGARPQSYTAKETAHLEVREQGGHLSLLFAQRTLRTNACWSPNPTVKLANSSSSGGRWRTECRTPQGEPRKESGRYTVTAQSAGVLELMEESEYDWRLEESHCVAQVRITQRLERRTGASSKAETEPSAPPCVPGEVTRLRLRPLEAELTPGERVCFQVRGFDAQGCASDVDPATLRWELKKQAAVRGTLVSGCFKAADAAADAEGTFRVSATQEDLHAEATVTVAAADLSDITARRTASKAQNSEVQPAFDGEVTGAGVKAVGVDRRLRWGPLALIASLALALLGAASFWLVRRHRQQASLLALAQTAPARPVSREATPMPAREPTPMPVREGAPLPVRGSAVTQVEQPVSDLLPSSPPEAPDPAAGALICPKCRRGYAPGARECTTDGTPLVPYADYVRRAKQQKAVVCGNCGAKLAAGAAFCGECGKKLMG
jgi:hypothetical protein